MLAFSAIVAGSFPLGARVAPYIDPGALTAMRFWLAAAVVAGVALAGPGISPALLRAPWRFALLGATISVYFVTMFAGLRTAAPVSQSAVFTLVPPMAAVFGWLLLRQRTTARMALALSIGGAGALWVIFGGSLQQALAFNLGPGERIYFIGCLSHALYAPLVPRLNRGEPPLSFSLGVTLAGAVLLSVWFAPQILATDWLALPPVVWLTLGYTAVFASAVTFMLLQYASLRLPAAKVMAYTYMTPSWVILLGALSGHGLPTALILPGIALTVLALAILLKD
ncbi:DMT family transporter [Pseudooceanicola sp. CBS1P-1]|uniref:EamA family transporter n=2 Tax=Paracoccaceae TaxID=31989 RepID=A0A6L7G2V3_9RHOB|nr:DMT family transporter [Pseudooceanicola endophyticus]MXN18455.1 EamA family transporter [Pseudooceanicola albus]